MTHFTSKKKGNKRFFVPFLRFFASSLVGVAYCEPLKAQVAYHPTSVLRWSDPRVDDLFVLAPYDIILDALNKPEELTRVPKGFRTSFAYKEKGKIDVNLRDFSKTRLSGAAQINENRAKALLSHLQLTYGVKPSQVYLIDLREEPHGIVNGHAVTWYYGHLSFQKYRKSPVIEGDEIQRIKQARAFPFLFIHQVFKGEDRMPFNKVPQRHRFLWATTERKLIESLGAHYIRLPVTDHYRPEDDTVDLFLNIVKALPEEAWVHFKCRGGRGRTTTFMALYDMLRNPGLTLMDYIKRQHLLGGVNLVHIPQGVEGWKGALSKDKLRFLKAFHKYRHDPKGYGHMSWSTWVQIHNYRSATGRYDIWVD